MRHYDSHTQVCCPVGINELYKLDTCLKHRQLVLTICLVGSMFDFPFHSVCLVVLSFALLILMWVGA